MRTWHNVRNWATRNPDVSMTLLRTALGLIFIIGGVKLIWPALFGIPDHAALAAKFTDPTEGYIAPFFIQRITETLGMPITTFLYAQGWIELLMGTAMMVGVGTPMVAAMMGLMFWSFTVANPVMGEIRLSRDLALMGLCVATALAGGGRWSADGVLRGHSSMWADRRDLVLAVIRLSVAFPLMVSAVFTGGVLDNHLNTTAPLAFVLAMGLLLAAGIAPRWIMLLVGMWMLYVVPANVVTEGLIAGLDSIKREIGLLAASGVYVVAGPDRWARPRPKAVTCRTVSDLVMAYLEGSLDRRARRGFEAHIADCGDCWRFLETYRQTAELGQSLREEEIPPELSRRLQAFLEAHR